MRNRAFAPLNKLSRNRRARILVPLLAVLVVAGGVVRFGLTNSSAQEINQTAPGAQERAKITQPNASQRATDVELPGGLKLKREVGSGGRIIAPEKKDFFRADSPEGGPPSNDNCANAIQVTPATAAFSNTQNTANATNQANEPMSTCGLLGNSIWYTYTNNTANEAQVDLDTCAANFDTVIMVWEVSTTACDFPNFLPVTCNDDGACAGALQSRTSFAAAPGKTYQIQVGGFNGATGTVTTNINSTVLFCPTSIITGSLGTDDPNSNFPFMSGVQTGRIFRDGIPTQCGIPETPCSVFNPTPQAYDAYTLTNDSGNNVCTNVRFTGISPDNHHLVAYSNSFNASAVCNNYLADIGSSQSGGSTQTMSFVVPANSNVVLVTHRVDSTAVGGQYSIEVRGNLCNPTTVTTITSDNPDPSASGQPVVVNYTVVPGNPGAGTPTGNVVVTASGGPETCTGTVAAGTCTLTLNGTGPRTLTATYAGNGTFLGSSDTEPHNVGVTIAGNIQQNNAPNANTPLAGVQVDLTGSANQQVFTDVNGNYAFTVVTAGGNYTVTPSGLGKTYSPASRTYNNLTTNITNANFLAFDQGQLQRNLTIPTTYATSPDPVTVPVILNAIGNERRVNFSLSRNPAILGTPTVVCGADAPGCTIVTNTSVAGSIGIQVTLAGPPVAGPRELVRVTFASTSNPPGNSNTPVQFTDNPTPRLTTDVANNPLATSYTSGFVVFSGATAGLEGDLATRFTGDGLYRSNDVELERQFVSGLAVPNGVTNEFERADTAPFATKGNGALNAADLQQTMNYVAGLSPQQTAGGPDFPTGTAPLEERDSSDDKAGNRGMRVTGGRMTGTQATVTIEMDSQGDETAALFTLNFDASRLSNPVVALAEGTPEGVTLTASTRNAAEGRVTVLLDTAMALETAYGRRLVTITFDVAKSAPVGDTPIVLSEVSFTDSAARDLRGTPTNGRVTVKGRGFVSSIENLFTEGPFAVFGF